MWLVIVSENIVNGPSVRVVKESEAFPLFVWELVFSSHGTKEEADLVAANWRRRNLR